MQHNKQIVIEVKPVYGANKAYPVCTDAKLFAAIAGTKTLTRNTLQWIANLGYSIIVEFARNSEFQHTLEFPESKNVCTKYSIEN